MNPAATYETDCYIFEEEIIFSYQELKTFKIETSEHSR